MSMSSQLSYFVVHLPATAERFTRQGDLAAAGVLRHVPGSHHAAQDAGAECAAGLPTGSAGALRFPATLPTLASTWHLLCLQLSPHSLYW